MKRIVFCFMAVIMILLVGNGFISSSADYDGEILFRDIPWGSNYYEVMEAINDLGIKKWREEPYYAIQTSEYLNGKTITHRRIGLGEDDTCNSVLRISPSEDLSKISIAGLNPKEITLYFVYTKAEDGTFPQDKGHTSLYMAQYEFDMSQSNMQYISDTYHKVYLGSFDLYSLLSQKLTSLYGETSEKKEQKAFGTDYQRIWKGVKNTALVIDSNGDCLLTYLWTGGDALTKEANDYLKIWSKIDIGSVDGL